MKKILLASTLLSSLMFSETLKLELLTSEIKETKQTFVLESLKDCTKYKVIGSSEGQPKEFIVNVKEGEPGFVDESSINKETHNMGLNYKIEMCIEGGAVNVKTKIVYNKVGEVLDTGLKQ